MSNKAFVPFGGVHGWLADLTVPANKRARTDPATKSYYVAVADQRGALAAIRIHAGVQEGAELVARRGLSRQEVQRLKIKPGQVLDA